MPELTRFGISLDADLLGNFDDLCARQGYTNRSEAIRDLIRAALVEDSTHESETPVAGVLTLLYDHHEGDLARRLTAMQHDFHGSIVATLHVHLDHHVCLEILVLKGSANSVKSLANQLLAVKGVLHGSITLTSAHTL